MDEPEFQLPPEEVDAACRESLPALAIHGLELFNQGAYFEAHEELELAWRAERAPVRELYRGILQVAVAYLHIQRGNYRGAAKMFLRSRNWLGPFPDRCCGIDLSGLRRDYYQVEEELLRLGPERIQWLDRGLMKPIQYTLSEESQ
jgi:predicted metal-dependent hydrolase